jgi:hypothetical protein
MTQVPQITINRWSTDAERDQLVAALKAKGQQGLLKTRGELCGWPSGTFFERGSSRTLREASMKRQTNAPNAGPGDSMRKTTSRSFSQGPMWTAG